MSGYARQGSPVDFIGRHWRALLALLIATAPIVWVGIGVAHEVLAQPVRIDSIEARIALVESGQREQLLQQRLTQQQLDMMQKASERDTALILRKLDDALNPGARNESHGRGQR